MAIDETPFPKGRLSEKECRVGEKPGVTPITATSYNQIYEDISLARYLNVSIIILNNPHQEGDGGCT